MIQISKSKSDVCVSCREGQAVIDIDIGTKRVALCKECSHTLLEKLIKAGKRVK